MGVESWRICRRTAQLTLADFAATLHVDAPHRGLSELQFAGQAQSGNMGGVFLPCAESPSKVALSDVYARGDDLIATYAETARRPFRTQVYWRAQRWGSRLIALGAIDLVVSLQTNQWQTAPTVHVRSVLPTEEVWWLCKGRFKPLSLDRAQLVHLWPQQGAGCLLCRVPGKSHSFVDMIHPTDFAQITLRRDRSGSLQIEHTLFGHNLEKGVILRARLRSLFVSRQRDLVVAERWYQALVESRPPLTA